MRRETRRRFTAPFVLTITAGTAGACAKSGTPEAPRSDLGATWYVTRRGDGCAAMEENRCPPDVMCNPPPPRPITCPAELADDAHGIRVTELAPGSCAVVPATCNARSCATPATACPDPWPTAPAAAPAPVPDAAP